MGFKKFIKYKNISYGKYDNKLCKYKKNDKKLDENGICRFSCKNGKNQPICSYPCPFSSISFKKLYNELTVDDLKLIYKNIKKQFKYDDKPFRFGYKGNRPRYVRLEGRSYYDINRSLIFITVIDFAQNKIKINRDKELALIKLERQKLQFLYQSQAEENAKTQVQILDVFKSRNTYQNNAISIGVKYKIIDTGEEFIDYITECKSGLLQYKTARLKIATDTIDIEDIFNKNFILWKSLIIGKELIVDTKVENGKRKVDYFIGSIFYNK